MQTNDCRPVMSKQTLETPHCYIGPTTAHFRFNRHYKSDIITNYRDLDGSNKQRSTRWMISGKRSGLAMGLEPNQSPASRSPHPTARSQFKQTGPESTTESELTQRVSLLRGLGGRDECFKGPISGVYAMDWRGVSFQDQLRAAWQWGRSP